jgi:hypothetical protein
VNNAGYGQFAPFEQMSAGDFQAIRIDLGSVIVTSSFGLSTKAVISGRSVELIDLVKIHFFR